MKNRYLTINSIDRENIGDTPSSFSISIKNGLQYQTCQLIMAQIPNTYYNITNNNNGITINDVICRMVPGNYNLDEFFNAFINLHPSIVGISYDDIICKITVTLDAPGSGFEFPSSGSMHSVIGFLQNYSASGVTHLSIFPPSLAKHILYIDIDHLSSNHTSSFLNSGVNVFEVQNNVNKNEMILYNEKTNFKQIVNCKNTSQIIYNLTIKLKNQFNEICTGASDWSMILSFY
jgi:hypothetical protein